MNCELCGYESDLVVASIEGVKLKVCDKCSSFGKILENKIENKGFVKQRSFREEVAESVLNEYNDIIKNAREKRSLTQEQLANGLNERVSIIHKIEQGNLKPS